MKKVVIYSNDLCSYCNKAKSFLMRENISFDEINISQNDQLEEDMIKKSSGLRTVPQIFIGEKHVGGYDDLLKIHNSKKLDSFLK